jgi:hypothetical protein
MGSGAIKFYDRESRVIGWQTKQPIVQVIDSWMLGSTKVVGEFNNGYRKRMQQSPCGRNGLPCL